MEAGGIEPACENERKEDSEESCVVCAECRAARALHSEGTGSQNRASNDADFQVIAHGWPQLHDAVRMTITMLVKANVSNAPDLESLAEERQKSRKKMAMRLAQECRYIIQGCLREEEWQDADQEFYDLIAPHL